MTNKVFSGIGPFMSPRLTISGLLPFHSVTPTDHLNTYRCYFISTTCCQEAIKDCVSTKVPQELRTTIYPQVQSDNSLRTTL